MLGLGKHREIAEHEAEGEVERVYHELRQKLRVTGVGLNFRTWAGYDRFFPRMWDAIRPNVETRAFEDAADVLRAHAVRAATRFGRIGAEERFPLGPSQSYRLRGLLALYHYVNPKLLLLTAAVRLALDGRLMGPVTEDLGGIELIERGAPAEMLAMDMADERSEHPLVREVFADIRRTLGVTTINSDFRSLALFPGYLAAAWQGLKPIILSEPYRRAADGLRDEARGLALTLPFPVPLSRQRLEDLGEDLRGVYRTTAQFEEVLPGLALDVALLALDWQPAESLAPSPFPAETRRAPGAAASAWRAVR